MKKVLTMIVVLACSLLAQAQNYAVLHVEDVESGLYHYCSPEFDGVIVYGNRYCPSSSWYVDGLGYYNIDSVLIDNQELHEIQYSGCGLSRWYSLLFDPVITNPFAELYTWMREGESVELYAPGDSVYWSTGEYTNGITVTEPGTYNVTITNACGSETYPIRVRNNVEVELATCDLESNLNMVIWQTTPEQAEYVSQVEVKRDGLTVGTVPYTDGQFIDNIGSDAASRTYTVTAIATDGTPCPIESYPKETIHMAYLTGINNTIEVNWNAPTGYELISYNICEWNATDGTLTTIDYVGASVNSYTCQQSQFDQGYIVIQGVEASKDGETRLLSNRSSETVGIGENESPAFKVYPNPAQGTFTVEGTGQMTITNVLGQTVLAHEIDGKENVELPRGIYFVKLNGATRKIVVK